ncbi:MAG TPA: hypothetical protein VFR31_10405 [Thermoanaerobaculia bacterium]|nr:hypothetical protein [Thermoanaerobaculia bacterium]
MLSKFAKLLLVATSLAPILLTHAFISALNRRWTAAAVGLGVAVGLTFICWLILSAARKQQQTLPLGKVKQLQAADTQIIGFVITYLLPLAKPQETPDDIRVLLFILFILGLAFWNSNAYHFNPLLGLLGYHFYEVTFCNDIKFVLITKRSLYDTQAVSEIVQLTEYVVLDTKE